jgi:hypothetical protein
MKDSIRQRLNKKSNKELDAIAKRLNYPLRGNKNEKAHNLDQYFKSSKYWAAISNA